MANRNLMDSECSPNVIKYPKQKKEKRIQQTSGRDSEKGVKYVEVRKTDKVNPKGAIAESTYVPDTNLTLACLVCICFNLPLGAIAMYLSLTAARKYRDGNRKRGECLAKSSVLLSLFSIVTTVLLVMAYVLWVVIESQAKSAKRQLAAS